ncbi:MAG: LacI family DNA-binding transcriptional regulator [Eubacteriales bacterium]|nr:LacI family DNA-binding transcriptional regulator [Eubacteriales bacterium]
MEQKKSKVTITDVANACGLSIKTVSRVINNSENVSVRTRNIVNQAIQDLGYKTNILARGLRGNKTNVIMIMTDRHEEEHLSSWHTLMLKYLFSYARKRHLKVIMAPSSATNFISDETDGYYMLDNGLVDGVIFLEHVPNDPRCEFLKENGIPFVLFGETEDDTVWSVSLDNYQVGFKGGRYLTGRGYRDIVFLLGDPKFNSNGERARGFLDAANETKGNYRVRYGISTVDLAYRTAKDILENESVDAFFVSGDERAIGVYRAIQEAGYQIPKDIAVLGIDNIPIGNYLHPRISTVDQDFDVMARECVSLLAKQINGEDIGMKRKVTYMSSVVEREST